MAVEAVCRITPRQNTIIVTGGIVRNMRVWDVSIVHVPIKPYLRPKKSAVGAAVRAPKKVPAERIETIMDDCEEVIAGAPSTV
jgi:hypothetical protein